MTEDNELEKLLTVGKSLVEQMHTMELNLISFGDLYTECLLTLLKKSDGSRETAQTLADEITAFIALQSEFAIFKMKFNIKLSSITKK